MDRATAENLYLSEYNAFAIKAQPGVATGSMTDTLPTSPDTYGLGALVGQVVNPVTDPLLGKVADLSSETNISVIVGSIQTTGSTPVSQAIFTFQRTIEIAYVVVNMAVLRTGGTQGVVGDAGAFTRRAAFKGVTASTPVLMTMEQDAFTQRDQQLWEVDIIVSGNNIYVQVTGTDNNTINWDFQATIVWRY